MWIITRIVLNTFAIVLLWTALESCKSQPQDLEQLSSGDHIREALLNADSGMVIAIPAGTISLRRSISLLGVKDVTIRGEGMHKSILSFADQIEGAEGLLIKADGITLEGFTVQDSKGDAIKIQDASGVIVREVRTTWTDGAKESNGGYGLYPVSCRDVLIENCEASFASDAGIYVGQCRNVLIRHNYAHHNVAGLEIENSIDVDAHDNVTENNTGGILIFDLPDLPQANGSNVRVFNNVSRSNNHKNFAPDGGMVATLPPGTGMLVIAHDNVEIFDNEILDYKTLGLGVISYFFTEKPFNSDNGFDPYYRGVYVHDNLFVRKKAIPDLSKEFGKMLNGLFFGKPQDIVIDGIFDPELADESRSICLQRNGDDLRFANLNAETAKGLGDLRKLHDRNMSLFACDLPPLEQLSQ